MYEQLGKLAARVAKGSVKKQLDLATKELFTKYADIYALENDYIDNYRQREILSPRAIQQGWVKELDEGGIELLDEQKGDNWSKDEKIIYTKTYGHAFLGPEDNEAIVSDLTAGGLLNVVKYAYKNQLKTRSSQL